MWDIAQKRLKHAMETQAQYYDAKHKPVTYSVGQLLLLSTVHLKVRGIRNKLQRKFVGPFRVLECIGSQSYRLELSSR